MGILDKFRREPSAVREAKELEKLREERLRVEAKAKRASLIIKEQERIEKAKKQLKKKKPSDLVGKVKKFVNEYELDHDSIGSTSPKKKGKEKSPWF